MFKPEQAYSNILKILPLKNEDFHIKILIFFIFLLKTEIVGTRWNRLCEEAVLTSTHNLCNKNNVYPCKLQFYFIKVGLKGVSIMWGIFPPSFYLPHPFYSAIQRALVVFD